MIELIELTPNVWALHTDRPHLNTTVLLGEEGAILVGPSHQAAELDALESFTGEMGKEVLAVVLMQSQSGQGELPVPDPDLSRWPGAEQVTPAALARAAMLGRNVPLPVADWEAVL